MAHSHANSDNIEVAARATMTMPARAIVDRVVTVLAVSHARVVRAGRSRYG